MATVAIDINHPGHVHFFKHFIFWLNKNGHRTVVVSSCKNVSEELLRHYGIAFHSIAPVNGSGLLGKLINLMKSEWQIFKLLRSEKPDIAFGIASFRMCHVGKFLNFSTNVFDDTEHSSLEILLYRPFAKAIFTPEWFRKDLGLKQVRYRGFHDFAYLHRDRFQPDYEVLKKYSLEGERPYCILRFISWEAHHDQGQYGFSLDGKRRLISLLASRFHVLISFEGNVMPEFAHLQLNIEPQDMHHVLAFATLLVGESGTMSSEAAVLGTTAVYVSSLAPSIGVFDELMKYGNLFALENEVAADACIRILLELPDLKSKAMDNADMLHSRTIDVTQMLIEQLN